MATIAEILHRAARRKAHSRKTTRWSDRMILEAIRDHDPMTPQAKRRAFYLVGRGFIDARGSWVLTPKGERYLRIASALAPLERF